jgi:diguanylate cyclase (GGDEF)-like protein
VARRRPSCSCAPPFDVSALLRSLLLALACALCAVPGAARALLLDDARARIDGWPVVSVLADPGRQMTLADVRAQRERFAPPVTAPGTLGHRRDAVWLHLPLEVAAGSDGRWVLDLEYAVLNRIDLHLLDAEGRVVQQARLGNLQPFAERPLPSRSHAVELALQPGARYEAWLRVETLGAMIVPLTLSKPPAFWQHALREQMLQGLLAGLGLCLLFYSLLQWVTLHDALLPKYALLIGGGILFSLVQFGIGAQYLWTDRFWAETHLAGIAALAASAGTFLFVEDVLRGPERHRWFGPVMKAGAAFLALVAVAYAVDLVDVHLVTAVIGSVGLAPALLGLPGALALARRGNPVGWLFIAAWIGYFVSTAVMVALIRGKLPANFWTLHSFQLGTTLDMLLFLRVLALRLHAVHAESRRHARERDSALSLARTDPLTGLPNRRGLNAALADGLARATRARLMAVYLIDLDGFKPVNDQHGHDAGDALLCAVATRLRASLRGSDVVARLGGDEFVVLAEGLPSDDKARELGDQLAAAFVDPFDVQGLHFELGATLGYALAPLDGEDPAALLKRADAAMYAGKQDGRNVLRLAAP